MLDDLIIELKEPQSFSENSRLIRINLSSRINISQFEIENNFLFDSGAISNVRADNFSQGKILVNILKNPVLNTPDNKIALGYSARSQNGEVVSGNIKFDNLDFEISAAPIDIELDACCELPDQIMIDVRDSNPGTVGLDSVGDNNTDAGTITTEALTGSDYNNDFNDDFGMEPHGIIKYVLNKETIFWKTVPAADRFEYTITHWGKTASNFITIKRK